jgi:hypothetical protein
VLTKSARNNSTCKRAHPRMQHARRQTNRRARQRNPLLERSPERERNNSTCKRAHPRMQTCAQTHQLQGKTAAPLACALTQKRAQQLNVQAHTPKYSTIMQTNQPQGKTAAPLACALTQKRAQQLNVQARTPTHATGAQTHQSQGKTAESPACALTQKRVQQLNAQVHTHICNTRADKPTAGQDSRIACWHAQATTRATAGHACANTPLTQHARRQIYEAQHCSNIRLRAQAKACATAQLACAYPHTEHVHRQTNCRAN